MRYDTLRIAGDRVEILDQRLLPGKVSFVKCRSSEDIFDAIVKMKIRGAPAIGIAGAFGVYLGALQSSAREAETLRRDIGKVSARLASSRPTARNLFWALERMEKAAYGEGDASVEKIRIRLRREAERILDEDKTICRKIGSKGRQVIKKGFTVLTHCNAGSLATGGSGTALGVITASKGKISRVYVDETRPLLQGARLTAWELKREGIPAVLICDGAAAHFMSLGRIDAVIVGADRIARNGDTANKIGTYALAVSARYHKVPFYVAAPVSTFDAGIPGGKDIPIEQRHGDEVRKISGKLITVRGARVENPAFDVTPARLITAIITEKGIVRAPYTKSIKRILGGDGGI